MNRRGFFAALALLPLAVHSRTKTMPRNPMRLVDVDAALRRVYGPERYEPVKVLECWRLGSDGNVATHTLDLEWLELP